MIKFVAQGGNGGLKLELSFSKEEVKVYWGFARFSDPHETDEDDVSCIYLHIGLRRPTNCLYLFVR